MDGLKRSYLILRQFCSRLLDLLERYIENWVSPRSARRMQGTVRSRLGLRVVGFRVLGLGLGMSSDEMAFVQNRTLQATEDDNPGYGILLSHAIRNTTVSHARGAFSLVPELTYNRGDEWAP